MISKNFFKVKWRVPRSKWEVVLLVRTVPDVSCHLPKGKIVVERISDRHFILATCCGQTLNLCKSISKFGVKTFLLAFPSLFSD